MELNHDKKWQKAECGALQHVRVNKNLVKGLGRLFLILLFLYKYLMSICV